MKTILTFLLASLLAFCILPPLGAQITFEKVYTEEGYGTNARFHPAGGYVLTMSRMDSVFDFYGDFLGLNPIDDIVRTDDWGGEQWCQVDSIQVYADKIFEILANGDILVITSRQDFNSSDDEIRLLRLDANGQILWAKNFDNPNNLYYQPRSIHEYPFGGIRISFQARGGTASNFPPH